MNLRVMDYGIGDLMSLQQINYKFRSFLDLVDNDQVNPITNEIMKPLIVDLHDRFNIQLVFEKEPYEDKETFKQLAERFRNLKSEFDRIGNRLEDDIKNLYQNLILQIEQIDQYI